MVALDVGSRQRIRSQDQTHWADSLPRACTRASPDAARAHVNKVVMLMSLIVPYLTASWPNIVAVDQIPLRGQDLENRPGLWTAGWKVKREIRQQG